MKLKQWQFELAGCMMYNLLVHIVILIYINIWPLFQALFAILLAHQICFDNYPVWNLTGQIVKPLAYEL